MVLHYEVPIVFIPTVTDWKTNVFGGEVVEVFAEKSDHWQLPDDNFLRVKCGSQVIKFDSFCESNRGCEVSLRGKQIR